MTTTDVEAMNQPRSLQTKRFGLTATEVHRCSLTVAVRQRLGKVETINSLAANISTRPNGCEL
jgi:hypothetical protein